MLSKYLIMIGLLLQFIRMVPLNDLDRGEFYWLNQRLDNFNESDTRTWKMRFWVNENFFRPGGPIFIMVGGEWEAGTINTLSEYIYELAKDFNAYLLESEHRYYGKSIPLPNTSTENLKYLSGRQAVEDLAQLIRYLKGTFPQMAKAKVILFGCSYGGTVAIWFSRRHPELLDGVWASGAPVNFKLENADQAISIGMALRHFGGDACYNRVAYMSSKYAQMQKTNDTTILSKLQAKNLTTYFDNFYNTAAVFTQHTNSSFMSRFCVEMLAIDEYDFVGFAEYLKEKTASLPKPDKEEVYFWYYQECNELAHFRTDSSSHQPFVRETDVSLSAQVAECAKTFGSKYTIDYINERLHENNAYFDVNKNFNNAVYVYAAMDPWRFAGHYDEHTVVIEGVGHCHDFRVGSKAPQMLAFQRQVKQLIISWLA